MHHDTECHSHLKRLAEEAGAAGAESNEQQQNGAETDDAAKHARSVAANNAPNKKKGVTSGACVVESG